jgi:hypothetical protein
MANASWLLVGAVYFGAVWLARRAGVEFRWRLAIFFYAIVFIFMREPLTTEAVSLPVDYLATMLPWREEFGYHKPLNSEMNDLVLQMVPWAHQVRESWKSLEIPLWNHLSGSGYPLLANGQSAALSPLRILALPLSLGQSFAFEAAMKLLIALTFTYLFCRRRGCSEVASAIGAISFAFSMFVLVWLHFPHVTTAAFLPAAMYQTDLLAERVSYARVVSTAVVWALILFGGHPETAAHIFFLSLLYTIFIAAVERRGGRRFIGASILALAVAALLAAPYLVPFAEAVTKSKRYQQVRQEPYTIELVEDWPTVGLLVQPHLRRASPEFTTGFAGILGVASWFALLIHVIRERKWRSQEAFFAGATLIVLAVVLGWPGISDLFHLVFQLAANQRLRLLLCFLLAVQIAAAVSRRELLAGILAAAVLLLFSFLLVDSHGGWDRDNAVLAMMPSMLVLLVALAGWKPALLVAVIAELWSAGRSWNPNVSEKWMYPPTPLIRFLEELKAKEREPFRIVGAGPSFFPNTPAVFGFEDIRAHDPMITARYVDRLRDLAGYTSDHYFAQWRNFETGLLDYLNVKYVVTPPRADLADPGRYAMLYDAADGRIFENLTVLPRFFTPRNVVLEFNDRKFEQRMQGQRDWRWTALLETLPVENEKMPRDMLWPRPASSPEASLKLTGARPTDFRMRVSAPRYTLVVSSIPWWPGWKVEGRGVVAPIRVNGAFFGFTVRPGVTDARVYYDPWTFRMGVWMSAGTLLTIGIFGLVARGRRYRRAPAAG